MSLWKDNWAQTQAHFEQWWNHRGLVVGAWGPGLPTERLHAPVPQPFDVGSDAARQTDAEFIAWNTRWKMSRRAWPADILPAAWPHIGTLPLATYLGARADYAPNNVWYHPCMETIDTPLRLDPDHPAVRELETICRRTVQVAEGNYFVGLPAILPGIDVLAELRGTAELLMDLLDNPAAVHRRLEEIQNAYRIAFDRLADIVRLPDGSMCFGYFMLHGPGRVGLCQCDTASMFSAEMFHEFVVPSVHDQCAFLDRSMFHVDGSQCLIHLDALLEIDDLDAIEYTPDPKVPGGGDPSWFPLYRRILDAGKSVWVANLRKEQVLPVLDAIGGKGVYVSVNGLSEADGEWLARQVEPYR